MVVSFFLSLSHLAVSLKAAGAVEAYACTCCKLRSGAPELCDTEEMPHCITQPLVMNKSAAVHPRVNA